MQEVHIRSWLRDKTIFVTGATGFLGKALIEKLLWDCSDIRRIYVLIRAKDQMQLNKRLDDYRKNPVFDRVRKLDENLLQKLYPIRGDLIEPKLAITEDDKNFLINEIDVILHSGASVSFEDTVKDAVLMNAKGTRELLIFAKLIKNLKSFVYVSTAYSNCNRKQRIEETIYNSLYELNSMIEICEKAAANNENEIDSNLVKNILEIYPNTYIFSKNLAETVVYEMRNELPLAIVRPSIISPAVQDPAPGWVDTKNGPMGLLLGAASGLVRSGLGDRWGLVDLLPVDYASNAIIAAAVNVGENNVKNCPVYNLSTGADFPISWNYLLEYSKDENDKNPLPQVLWYPGGNLYKNYYLFLLGYIIFQIIPAIFLDALLFIVKQKFFFVKIQLKTYKKVMLFSYFVKNTWKWDISNTKTLFNKLDISERISFNFRAEFLNFRKYIKDWNRGSRKYLLGVDADATKSEKQKILTLYYLDLIVRVLFYSYLVYRFYIYFFHRNAVNLSDDESCIDCSEFKLS